MQNIFEVGKGFRLSWVLNGMAETTLLQRHSFIRFENGRNEARD
jgi:hypothetical protein